MLSSTAPNFEESKINRQVENVDSIRTMAAPTPGTQMIFCDMGVTPTPLGDTRSASFNPAILTLAEAYAELQRHTLLKKNRLDEQYVARRSVRELPERLANLTADQATPTTHANDQTTIGSRPCGREDAPANLPVQLDALPRNVRETTRRPLGIYRGLRFGMVLPPQFPPEVYLEGAITRQTTLSRERQGPRAVLERLVGAYGSECDRVRQRTSQSPNRSCVTTRPTWVCPSYTMAICPN
jgi:hypothetical protein